MLRIKLNLNWSIHYGACVVEEVFLVFVFCLPVYCFMYLYICIYM